MAWFQGASGGEGVQGFPAEQERPARPTPIRSQPPTAHGHGDATGRAIAEIVRRLSRRQKRRLGGQRAVRIVPHSEGIFREKTTLVEMTGGIPVGHLDVRCSFLLAPTCLETDDLRSPRAGSGGGLAEPS